MVNMDGFILTHAYERVYAEPNKSMRSCHRSTRAVDPSDPASIGAMVGPEAFTEVRYLAHQKQLDALELIPQVAAEFQEIFTATRWSDRYLLH